MSNTENSSEKNAQFHWGEANKFALEFCKSFFLFNSSLSVALIAYIGSGSRTHEFIADIKIAIGIFLFVAACSILLFFFGYQINLMHGNSYRKSSGREALKSWNWANRIQGLGYLLFVVIIGIWMWGFHVLFKGLMI